MGRCIGCFQTNEDDVNVCPFCGYSTEKKIEGYYLKPGTELYSGRYIVGNVLGRGGFGITYLAWDNIAEKKVSIKEYFPSSFSSRNEGKTELSVYSGSDEECFKEGLIRFIDEAQRLAKLVYIEGIIQINECFEENNTAYIVMEYLDGESLSQKLDREGKIAPDMAINLLIPIMQSLIKVHKEGIIHRDISPDNIFILKDGTAKLLDFGSARQAIAERSSSMTVIVKEGYSPEEQYSTHGEQGTWTDVYSMGATLFRMITGEKLLAAVERRSRLVKNKKDSSSDLSTYGIKVDDKISTAINNALKLDTHLRTQTMESLIEELQPSCHTDKENTKTLINKESRIVKKKSYLKLVMFLSIGFIISIFMLFLYRNIIDKNIQQRSDKLNNSKSTEKAEQLQNDSDNVVDVKMPNIVGMLYEQAISLLEENHIEYEIAEYVENINIDDNTIISQSIDENVLIKHGTKVKLVVSCKVKDIEIVDIVGLNEKDAVSRLESLGLKVQIIYEKSTKIKEGIVVSQTPAAGLMTAKECVIMIKVSNGNASVNSNKTAGAASTTVKPTASSNLNKDNNQTNIVTNQDNQSNVDASVNNSIVDNTTAVVSNTKTPEIVRNETPASSFIYTIVDNKYVTIDKFIGSESNVIIPERIEGCIVNKIGSTIFSEVKQNITVDIPETITVIESSGFLSTYLSGNVYLPKSIISLGGNAFSNNYGPLKSVDIDISTDISEYCFFMCYGLTKVRIGDGVKVINSYAFFDSALVDIVIPESIKEIHSYAFGYTTWHTFSDDLTIRYRGTEEQYKTLLQSVTTEGNDRFINAKVVYNYKD